MGSASARGVSGDLARTVEVLRVSPAAGPDCRVATNTRKGDRSGRSTRPCRSRIGEVSGAPANTFDSQCMIRFCILVWCSNTMSATMFCTQIGARIEEPRQITLGPLGVLGRLFACLMGSEGAIPLRESASCCHQQDRRQHCSRPVTHQISSTADRSFDPYSIGGSVRRSLVPEGAA